MIISNVNGTAFPVPFILIGGNIFFLSSIFAPILDKCSVTLFMGLLLKELSPINFTSILFVETNPEISLIPVPELPKSIIFFGWINPPGGMPKTSKLFVFFIIFTPNNLIALRVFITSSLCNKFLIFDLPTIWPVKIKILWLIDLSPGGK